jgi:NAD(P)-dependent dehydrogenase (short-subunit alcohol dehydrogenase family)
VRSNGILPGAVLTDIANHWPPEAFERTKTVPMGRSGTPEDFVGAALWLASAASGWVTGELVRVDGGSYRQMS